MRGPEWPSSSTISYSVDVPLWKEWKSYSVLPRVLKSLIQNIPESCNTKEKNVVGLSGILVGNCTSLFTSLFLDSYLLTAEETAAYVGL